MIRIVREGEGKGDGLNTVLVSDGGIALALFTKRYSYYFRIRGWRNRIRPRVYWSRDARSV